MADNDKNRVKAIMPADAIKKGGFTLWSNPFRIMCKVKKCSAALPTAEVSTRAMQMSSIKSIVSVQSLDTPARGIAAEGGPSVGPPQRVRLSTGTPAQQDNLAYLLYEWTDSATDWILFNEINMDDPDFATLMYLAILRKYMALGSHPVQEFQAALFEPQRAGENAVELWERIKRSVHGLRSAGREIGVSTMADALKAGLSSEHMHWAMTIDPTTCTEEDLNLLVYDKGQFIDRASQPSSNAAKSAFPSTVENENGDMKKQLADLNSQVGRLTAMLAADG